MLLDRDGDLVERPAASTTRPPYLPLSPEVALDPRVGMNIRLGNDPPQLPPGMQAQAEPHIARAPNNPNILLATFQEGRFTTAGAVDCGFSVSQNAGLNWTRALIPGLTMTSGGPYFRATDPVAGVDASGNLYLETLAAVDTNFNSGVVVVSRSTDGGVSFGPPRVAYQPPNNTVFPDKDWMAINTFSGTPTFGRIFVTFTLFTNASVEGAPIAGTYSDNGGITWSPAAFIHPADTNAQGSQPVYLPDGRLAIVYWNFGTPSSPGERLEVVVSNTAGTVFGAPVQIANAVEYFPPNIRSGSFLPSATVDRTTGNLYVVYQAFFAGAPRVLFTKSTNGGANWTAPIAISNNTTNTAVFNPAIAASPGGQRLSVAFYDKRVNPGNNTLVDMFMAFSFDGGDHWQSNIRLTSVSSDASLAPLTSEGYMLGDYLGVAESTSPDVPAVPVWVDTRTGNPDPFVAQVSVEPVLAPFDFNGDGSSDLIFQNNSTGQRALWLMNGTTRSGTALLPSAATEWSIVGAGDFNNDDQNDIVLQDYNMRKVAVWYLNGTTYSGSAYLPDLPRNWSVAAAGDFNGDNKPDLVLENLATGRRAIWLLNGIVLTTGVYIPTTSLQWKIVGTGDFNNDGQTDILFQNNSTRQVAVWRMNGTTFVSGAYLPTPAAQWQVAGTGDFDNDSQADLVLQNISTGQRSIWLMNGTLLRSGVYIPSTSVQWEIRNR